MKLLMIAAILAIFAHARLDQSTNTTVDQFRRANAVVQDTARQAAPHVQAVFDQLLVPAVQDFKRDAQNTDPHHPVQSPSTAKLVEVERPAWADRSMHCYQDSKWHNTICQ